MRTDEVFALDCVCGAALELPADMLCAAVGGASLNIEWRENPQREQPEAESTPDTPPDDTAKQQLA